MNDRENSESRVRRGSEPPAGADHRFPVVSEDIPGGDESDRDYSAKADRKRSVIEMMNGPARSGKQAQAAVLWLALAFVAALFSLTTWVMFISGVNWLALFSLVILGYILIALAGMLRYKGQDPMAQFDTQRPVKRRRGKRGKRGS